MDADEFNELKNIIDAVLLACGLNTNGSRRKIAAEIGENYNQVCIALTGSRKWVFFFV